MGALGDRPLCLGVFLGLHGPEPADHLRRGVERLRGQTLLVHSPVHDGEAVEAHERLSLGARLESAVGLVSDR